MRSNREAIAKRAKVLLRGSTIHVSRADFTNTREHSSRYLKIIASANPDLLSSMYENTNAQNFAIGVRCNMTRGSRNFVKHDMTLACVFQ